MNRAAAKGHDKRCGTCAHADIPRTPTGRFRRNVAGRCVCPVELPPLPTVVVVKFLGRTACWPDAGAGCPTWRPMP